MVELSDLKSMFVGKLDSWQDRARILPGSLLEIALPHPPGSMRGTLTRTLKLRRHAIDAQLESHYATWSERPGVLWF